MVRRIGGLTVRRFGSLVVRRFSGLAVRRFGVLPEGQTLPPLVPGGNLRASPGPTGPTPKLGIEQTEYDFGVMDLDAEMSHDFTFTNTGEATLELTAAKGQNSWFDFPAATQQVRIIPFNNVRFKTSLVVNVTGGAGGTVYVGACYLTEV